MPAISYAKMVCSRKTETERSELGLAAFILHAARGPSIDGQHRAAKAGLLTTPAWNLLAVPWPFPDSQSKPPALCLCASEQICNRSTNLALGA